MDRYKIAIVVGSLRDGSINKRIARSLCAMAHERLDCDMVPIGDLPLYNQDSDPSPPPQYERFRAEIAAGKLPPGQLGYPVVQSIWQGVDEIAGQAKALISGEASSVDVQVEALVALLTDALRARPLTTG